MHQPCFQGCADPIAPPTLVHLDKLRLYRHACPGGTGPHARVHYEYDATVHAPVYAGTRLSVKGTVTDRYVKRGRDHVVVAIDMRAAEDGRLLIAYRDTVILAYRPQADGATEKKP
jgi:acyl dehydratase